MSNPIDCLEIDIFIKPLTEALRGRQYIIANTLQIHNFSATLTPAQAASFKIVLDLQCVFSKGSLNLLIEMFITVIDRVNVLLFVEPPPPTECVSLLVSVLELLHHPVNLVL